LAIKIAINGLGRIGRSVVRVIASRDDVELVGINDIMSLQTMEYLLKFDSIHGNLDVKLKNKTLYINNTAIVTFNKSHPKELDFASCGADVVLECSGRFLTTKDAQNYIDNGIKKVILSAPCADNTPTYVLGVNANQYKSENIISNASCTTNCIAPIAKILDDNFEIKKGFMTTIHSYTNDQNILDQHHSKELRKSRAAAINMIPTSTGAAKALKLVIPSLKNKIHGQSIRVPTPNVSMVDFNILLNSKTTKQEIIALLNNQIDNGLSDIISLDNSYKVSSDIVGDSHSSIIPIDLIELVDKDMLKIMAWYDNEWGYSNRLIDMALYISR
jgi:glyceraldehyde 3-phosphate dehydrogenase